MVKKILVVDDDRFYSTYLKTLLSKNFPEYMLLMAKDGEEAWEILQAHTWSAVDDVLILDLEMPRLNGYGLLKRMFREMAEAPRVVVNSNYKFRDQERTADLATLNVANKPLNSSKVREVLRQLGDA
ncbi:MAG TPA: response regulator [Luteibaculaceae bacterium]|nr:response regulator [Luteibaculaceae bacterium]